MLEQALVLVFRNLVRFELVVQAEPDLLKQLWLHLGEFQELLNFITILFFFEIEARVN